MGLLLQMIVLALLHEEVSSFMVSSPRPQNSQTTRWTQGSPFTRISSKIRITKRDTINGRVSAPCYNTTELSSYTSNELNVKTLDLDASKTVSVSSFEEADAMQQMEELEKMMQQSRSICNEAFFDDIEEDVVASVCATTDSASDTSSGHDNGSVQKATSNENRDLWNARLLLLAAAALYGTNFSIVKVLDEAMPVGISTTLRFCFAALASFPWLIAGDASGDKVSGETDTHTNAAGFQQLWQWNKSENLAAAFAGFEVGAWNSVGYVAQAVGLQTTDASKSAFLCSLAVVVVPILDLLIGKRMLPLQVIGTVMAVAGVGILELGGSNALSSLGSGDIASLIQPVAFGVGFWRMEDAMRKFPNGASRMAAAQVMAVFIASAGYCTFSCSGNMELWPGWERILEWVQTPTILGSLVWTGIVTTALTVYMENLALKTLSAAETTLLFSTEPLWGAACASFLIGEQLGWESAIGGALILGACVTSNINMEWFQAKEQMEDDKETTPTEDALVDAIPQYISNSAIAGTAGGLVSLLQETAVDEEILDDIVSSIN